MTSASPRLRVETACLRLGRDEFISRCVAMLAGGEEESDFIVTVGGAPALHLLGAANPEGQAYGHLADAPGDVSQRHKEHGSFAAGSVITRVL